LGVSACTPSELGPIGSQPLPKLVPNTFEAGL
jgi:hypothetical protein